MNYIYTPYIASVYNEGAYGAGLYGESQTTTPVNGGVGTPAAPGLADTGFDILIPVFLAVSLLLASAILLTKKVLRKRNQNKQWDARA